MRTDLAIGEGRKGKGRGMLRLQHQSHAIDPHSTDIPSSLQAAVVAFRLRFLSLHF